MRISRHHSPHVRRRRGRRRGLRRLRRPGFGAATRLAEVARDAQHRRCRRQSRADAEGDRELPQGQAQARLADHLHQGAGAGAAGQDQGAAGRRPRRHRPRADRHRRAVGRHRPEALGRAARRTMPAACRSSTTSICRPPPRCRRSPRARASWSPTTRPARCSNTCRSEVKKAPTTAEELLAWAQGQPEPLHVRAPGQFRPRPHLHDGPALHPRRQGPEGSGEGLGQDLGLSQGARPEHRILPDRHRRDDEGARRRLARHDRLDDRLGHQPARARHRAEGGQGRARSRASTGSPTRTTCACRRASRTRSSRCCST